MEKDEGDLVWEKDEAWGVTRGFVVTRRGCDFVGPEAGRGSFGACRFARGMQTERKMMMRSPATAQSWLC
ncbi:hypothetical protein HYQ46_011246 [Verticillium longisporum]|nr:hypothetical protein HYQ46_011246 [Verticillium longisporum]